MFGLKLSTVLMLTAIGSCAAGEGLSAAEHAGWGTGLTALGTGLVFYVVFFLYSNE